MANAACQAPRLFAVPLRRHSPASSSNSHPNSGTNSVFIASAAEFAPPPPAVHFPIPAADFLARLLPSASSVIASIVVVGAPFGATEAGWNPQSIPSGTFEQENCTCWLNPFVGVTVTTAMPACDGVTVTLEGDTESVKFPAAAVMLIENAVEVEFAKFGSPPYCAVIECIPTDNAEVEKVATPDAFSGKAPKIPAPSLKVTWPVDTLVPLAGATLAMIITFAPDVAVAGPVSVVVVLVACVALTVTVKMLDVLGEKFASPPYFALIECVPGESVLLVKKGPRPVANVPVAIAVAPSKMVTVPVGRALPLAGATVAVNVKFPPESPVVGPVTVVVVPISAAAFTTCDTAGEVLAAKFASPLYCAVMECVPWASVADETAAAPAAIVTGVPICVAPSKKVNVPVMVPAVAEVTVAVNVTLAPVVEGFSDEVTEVVVAAAGGTTLPFRFSSTTLPPMMSGFPSPSKSVANESPESENTTFWGAETVPSPLEMVWKVPSPLPGKIPLPPPKMIPLANKSSFPSPSKSATATLLTKPNP